MSPQVTCLCLTKDRPQYLTNAIRCFNEQTYKDSHLLVLDSSLDCVIPPAILEVEDYCKRVTYVNRNHALFGDPKTIGALRNLAGRLANTQLLASWDDDDWSAPERLERQIYTLANFGNKRSVIGYHTMKFTDGSAWWKYCGQPHVAMGTSLLYKRVWWEKHPFPETQVGEDTSFAAEAWTNQQLHTEDATGGSDQPFAGDSDMMVAHIHQGNSSKKIMNNPYRRLG